MAKAKADRRQAVLFAKREMQPDVREFVRERLHGLELRQQVREARRARRRGAKVAGGGRTDENVVASLW